METTKQKPESQPRQIPERDVWEEYRRRKEELAAKNPTTAEYDAGIREIVNDLGI